MKKMNKKKLVLSLIKDDLIHAKLIYGLNEVGLNASNYFLHLSDTIFDLLGYEDNEETERIFRQYIKLSKSALFLDITKSHKALDNLVLKIYRELSAQKPHD
ncbi:MAG: hypothetical protein C0448_02575 [Sphingobacteriaceae bacterium]|nr:hypothetical protein [Sphingobacteriaceae bacterium]